MILVSQKKKFYHTSQYIYIYIYEKVNICSNNIGLGNNFKNVLRVKKKLTNFFFTVFHISHKSCNKTFLYLFINKYMHSLTAPFNENKNLWISFISKLVWRVFSNYSYILFY